MESHIVEEMSRAVQDFLRVAEQPRTNEGGRGPASSRADVSFCMTRFDALVDPLIVIFQRMLKPLFATLTEEESDGGEKSTWATEILDRNLAWEPLVSLGLALDMWWEGGWRADRREQRQETKNITHKLLSIREHTASGKEQRSEDMRHGADGARSREHGVWTREQTAVPVN